MPDARFHTTRWSMIVAAAKPETDRGARAALEELCRVYWYPVFAFVRRRGYGHQDALDRTQGYFAGLLEKGLLQAADRERGRFRSFLLTTVKQNLSDERKRTGAVKRGGAVDFVSLEAARAEELRRVAVDPADSPERAFERQWALTVFEQAKWRLENEFVAAGKQEHYRALQGHLAGDHGGKSHAEVAAELGVSEGAIKMAVKRLRQRFGKLLREEIAETVCDDGDVDDEVRHLLSAI